MIFYYSATGNTAYVTRELARLTGERHPAVSIPEALSGEKLDIYRDKTLGFLFPIYGWGVPHIVEDFLQRLPAQLFDDKYIWAVCTCGDEAGKGMCQFASMIRKISGREPDLLASVIMPNTYVLMPGFNVDSTAVEEKKLSAAPHRIAALAEKIKARETGVYDVTQGSVPGLRSGLLQNLFYLIWDAKPSRWHVNPDTCISCGKCARICPVRNIQLGDTDQRPVWSTNCLGCCACYHVCPTQSIAYGRTTKGKGQYLFPGYPFKP